MDMGKSIQLIQALLAYVDCKIYGYKNVQDKEIIVLNKPSGLAVQVGSLCVSGNL